MPLKLSSSSRLSRNFILALILFLSAASLCEAKKPFAGPVQPTLGPGSRQYEHAAISHWQSGISEELYYVFEPDQPRPEKAGLVLFLHDWLASDPGYYMAWIRHLCRKGWVVVFPRYQGSGELEKTWLFHAVRSTKDFLMTNFKKNGIEIDSNKFAVIGHGAGAILAANLAATDRYFGLPRCNALFIITPHKKNLKLFKLSSISKDAKMVVLTGDRVDLSNEHMAREIFYAADRIKTRNKIYVTVYSDYYGQPPLVADEAAAFAPEKPAYERFVIRHRNTFIKLAKDSFHAPTLRTSPVDAFDYFATFRLFDALAESAFAGQARLNIFKDNAELRFMGYWSDGKKLRGMIADDRP
jgi:pimeloyl-ACP methyl ester carboxylesterase